MGKNLVDQFVLARSRLLAERKAIIERLAVLDELLSSEAALESSEVRSAVHARIPKAAVQTPMLPPREDRTATEPLIPRALNWEVRPDAGEFPVAMFPFPERAHSAFERNGIRKLGDLHRLGAEVLKQKNIGRTTLDAITGLIDRVNRGELFFPASDAVPIHSYTQLIDAGLEELEQPAAVAIQQRLGVGSTLDESGSQPGLTRERIRQSESLAIGQLTRQHGARLFQIGKALGVISKARSIEFTDISDPANPPRFSAEFYLALLGWMFPGLATAQKGPIHNDPSNPAPSGEMPVVAAEPPTPDELRERIFGSETAEPIVA